MYNKSQKPENAEEPKKVILNIRICSVCHRDISNEIYVKCSRCADFNQCLECFSIGAEAQNHLKTHPFVILEPVIQPIFQKGWSSEQEILLLNALQSCGIGNWHEIADTIKTKTAEECECHYFSTYIESPTAPIPLNKVIKEAKIPPPPDFDTSPRESRPSISHEKNMAERGKKERTTPAEFAGYMPRRHEFEVEYLNDAEQLVSGIEFSETEETEETLEKKLNQLRVYNEQLEERYIRTQFSEDYDLLDQDFKGFGSKNKQEKDIEEQFLSLGQILTRDKLTEFIDAYKKEMRLKDEIENLLKWRKNCIMTVGEGKIFNQLEILYREDKLSTSAIERLNKDYIAYSESPDFKTTLYGQMLTESEDEICKKFQIYPHDFLKMKDEIIREYTVSGHLTEESAASLCPEHEDIMRAIFQNMQESGLL